MKTHNALDRQRHIYITGFTGVGPVVPVSSSALETQAAKAMSAEAYSYIAGGAGQEKTMQANLNAFDRYYIVPRMLRDVSSRDTSLSLLGRAIPAPLLLAPIGVLEMVHPEADKAVGKAAATLGIPYIFSNQASVPMEEVSQAMGEAVRWFQLYWSRSDELVESLVKRAEDSACEAIVLTLDTTMLGWRTRDLDMAYLPFLEGPCFYPSFRAGYSATTRAAA
jgi:lactate 2-monooxygenase